MQWILTLYETFAECGLTNDQRPVEILESTADDLAGACRTVIDEHDEWRLFELIARVRIQYVVKTGVATLGINDRLVATDKLIGNTNGLFEITAGVTAK